MDRKLNKYILGMMFFTLLFIPACNLDEEILDEYTADIVQSDENLLLNLIAPPLGQLRILWGKDYVWGFQEATSDELFFPTRGADWNDNGAWRADYLHTWTPTHTDDILTWNSLNSAISVCNTTLFNLSEEKADDTQLLKRYRAQAKFLRAFYEYLLYDLYRVYPVRSPFDLDFARAPDIYAGENGFNRLVTTVKSILPQIITRGEAKYGQPNRDAAVMLLAKLYLNKGVYVGVPAYDSCLIFLNQLIDSNHYGLANNYYNMFSVANDQNYKKADDEAIFVAVFDDGDNYGLDNSQVVWVQQTFHYNQTLGGNYTGWNGCSAPEGYLTKNWINGSDTATDVRWKDNSVRADMGINLGFNYGQQYNPAGDSLFDRAGNPLIYTFDCPLTGANECQGVRVIKYAPRPKPVNMARIANDFLIWRYADALLMKAECLVRAQNDIDGALAIVNEIRTKRNAPVITASTVQEMLDKILIERGLELYWEGHRRQDMIRFGTFLLPKDSKPDPSPATAILLPIPQSAIDGTPGGVLHQNPGY